MEMLNKLKSTVSTTVSQLSGVLPGNPVTREYEVGKQIGSAGPDLLWKIYSGFKKSTRQEASIFVLEKKLLDGYSKKDRDAVVELLRKGVVSATRLRHPQILTVQHPVEESRESLAFATEPVFASLANILGKHDNVSPVPQQLKDYKLFELEIKYGLQQLTEGLIFLHDDVKLLHCNLCPESIVVNQQGAFKIFGFDFCVTSPQESGSSKSWLVREPDPELPSAAQSNLDYIAPELGRNPRRHGNANNTVTCTSAADMYSLGCVIASIYSGDGHSPYKMDGDVESFFRHAQTAMNQVQNLGLAGLPAELVQYVRQLLQPAPENRTDAHQLVKISFFDDVGVKTLNYLDSLFQWDNLQKSQFFKGLPQILPRLPERVQLHRVMPCLAKELVNPSMVPFILPCVLFIAQETSNRENYVLHILPHLKPCMKLQEPVQVLLIFMQRMELLLQKTPPDDVKSDVLPMVYRALESEAAPQIQELCLSVIPSFASLVDYPAMKNALMPRIKKLCLLPTSPLSVRVNGLLCIGKLLDHVDKWLVLDDILPMLPQIPSRDPAVIMAILGVYKVALEHQRLGIPKETIATQVVPFLFPLLVEPGLSLSQFRAVVAIVKEMMAKVEEEQRVKLESVAALNEEQRNNLGQLGLNNQSESGASAQSGAQKTSSNSAAVSEQIDALFAQLSATTSPAAPAPKTSSSSMMTLKPVAAAAVSTASPAVVPSTTTNWTPMMSAAPPAISPAPTSTSWRLNTPSNGMANLNGTAANKRGGASDPVSSMIQSNLTAMGGSPRPATTPMNQWSSSNLPTSQPNFSGWNSNVATTPSTPLLVQQPTMAINTNRMAQPMIPSSGIMQPLLPSSSSAHQQKQPPSGGSTVRPLGRADIDDLLS